MGREKETHPGRGPAQLTQLSPLTTLAGGDPTRSPACRGEQRPCGSLQGHPSKQQEGSRGCQGRRLWWKPRAQVLPRG